MKPLTVNLPTDFIQEIDQARERLPGVRSRSAMIHLLAVMGLRSLEERGTSISLLLQPAEVQPAE